LEGRKVGLTTTSLSHNNTDIMNLAIVTIITSTTSTQLLELAADRCLMLRGIII
jgi:hypothetical protein